MDIIVQDSELHDAGLLRRIVHEISGPVLKTLDSCISEATIRWAQREACELCASMLQIWLSGELMANSSCEWTEDDSDKRSEKAKLLCTGKYYCARKCVTLFQI